MSIIDIINDRKGYEKRKKIKKSEVEVEKSPEDTCHESEAEEDDEQENRQRAQVKMINGVATLVNPIAKNENPSCSSVNRKIVEVDQ